ncbi:hypothetical protein Pla175_23680 [Pirellulimonas nuda]|uniref:Preprotein translocase subunit SecA n=2 Tax=Pirellulimonas nuda TaxID=2528009 RepID=A0A518DBX1_9BACT|nr:hypothetical protein Pla175_23680 [Pirellulimonas nuda]
MELMRLFKRRRQVVDKHIGDFMLRTRAANGLSSQASANPLPHQGVLPCPSNPNANTPFEPMSKRRRGYPSETRVKVGVRVVHGDKLLEEKLGRNDSCPCGSGQRFKICCLRSGRF